MRKKHVLLSTLAALAVVVSTASPLGAWGNGGNGVCEEWWYPLPTAITAPSIDNPTAGNNGCGINAEVTFICSKCTDTDRHRKTDCTFEQVPDTLKYTWSCTGEGWQFIGGNTGRQVTWKAPDTPGDYTVTVTVDDMYLRTPGSDNDPARTAERTMEVIRLDKVRLYFYYSGGQTAYPYVGGPTSKMRAVVTATHTSQEDYCDLGFDTGLKSWWKTGEEGPGGTWEKPPESDNYLGAPADWPNNWPALDIDWKLLWHNGSAPCNSHPRYYSYSESEDNLPDSWGEDNRVFTLQGIHRLRATATIHAGAGEQKGERTVTSRDKEYALRICPKAYCDWIDNAMRRDYIEWCTTYVNEPYEWGGNGFGGLDSNGECVGEEDIYEGYGIDCSGLVSCGAYRADCNWSTWRVGTCPLAGDYCSDPILLANFDEGDIIVKCQAHVVSCMQREDPPYEDEARIIHASADSYKPPGWEPDPTKHKVLEEDALISWWTDRSYSLRRLEAH